MTASMMPDAVREEGEELVRALAAVAGDETAVYDVVAQFYRGHGRRAPDGTRVPDDAAAVTGLVAALLLTFTECLIFPTAPGDTTPINLPV